MSDRSHYEKLVLETLHSALDRKFADIQISIEDGQLKKLWLTEKTAPDVLKGVTRLKENETL